MQVGNGCTGTHCRRNCTAVGAELAQLVFLVDGDQVAEHQRADLFFAAHAQRIGEHLHRQAYRHALVAAAGVDHHRQHAAVHARIAAGGGQCPRHGAGVAAVVLQNSGADICAVLIGKAFAGNGHIAAHLVFHQAAHLGNVHRVGKVIDVVQVQQGTIRLGGVLGAHALFHHHSAVVLNAHDVGVGECDLHQSGLLPGSQLHDDLQVGDAFQQGNAADLFAQQFPRQFQILRGDVGKHLQLFVRVAAHGAQHRAGLNAFHVACGGHNDRFDVFDDVAAAPDINVLRQSAQNAARLGRRVEPSAGTISSRRMARYSR